MERAFIMLRCLSEYKTPLGLVEVHQGAYESHIC